MVKSEYLKQAAFYLKNLYPNYNLTDDELRQFIEEKYCKENKKEYLIKLKNKLLWQIKQN